MAKPTYRQKWENNAATALNGALATGATSVPVVDGSVFGGGGISATYIIKATIDDGTNVEIVHITNVSGNTLTVVRAQEGTSSPASFADGTPVEVRLTNETLEYLDPLTASYLGSIEIGPGADTDALGAIAIGESSYGGEGAAGSVSHYGQIAIGMETTTGWVGSIAIGYQANAKAASSADTGGIAFGWKTVSQGNATIAFGKGNGTTTGYITTDYSIGIGGFFINDAVEAITIGHSASAAGTAATYSVNIGNAAKTTASGTIAIGREAQTADNYSTAFGQRAEANYGGGAYGQEAKSYGQGGVALGPYVKNYHIGTVAALPSVCPREDGLFAPSGEASHLFSNKVTVTFPPMDLGVPQTWTTAATYLDQEVVVDPTPVGTEQHYLVIGSTASDIYADSFYVGDDGTTPNQSVEGTEPTWAATQGGKATATAANSQWVMIDPKSGVNLGVGAVWAASGRYKFVPTRIGFFCFEITGTHTTKPTFNFGNESSATAYKSAEAIDLITADNQMQWWDIGGNDAMVPGAENLIVTLVTAGDGNLFMGKFVVEGILMALRG